MQSFGDIAFTASVQALQADDGSRAAYARMQQEGAPREGLGPRETEFLGAADTAFLATVSETGWPYVQHRGGPRGFLKVLAPQRIAFADFRGNRQFVTAGNALRNDRAALLVMDLAQRRRLKLLGRLHFHRLADADRELALAVALPGYPAVAERVALFDVEAYDWNCPQHITPRFTREEIEAAAAPLFERIARMEAELEALRRPGGEPRPA